MMCKGISMEKFNLYQNCVLCPRECKSKRLEGQTGVCKVTDQLKVARAALHYWEEPCISGSAGSGAVFFSGCSMHCVFCQNVEIAQGNVGKVIDGNRLAEIFLELQEKGANNINLVTPGQYVPHIVYAIEKARNQGLFLPIIYNTSGYEKVDTIKRLEGIVDVYLPDFKYFDSSIAQKYSNAADYPTIAKAAIEEMVRQKPHAYFYPENKRRGWKDYVRDGIEPEVKEGYLIGSGVIVRQLLLPGCFEDAKKIVRYLYDTYEHQVYVSLMSQFTPLPHLVEFPELNRKVTENEYDAYVDYAIEIGIENGFIEEGDVAEESFIPDFNCEGV